jgi:lactate dehydrogenase-like 2-hydroxyacid dehydrogenase
MKLAVLDKKTLGDDIDLLDGLTDFGDVSIFNETKPSETITRLQNIQIVITNKVHITKEVMDACPTLQLICVTATGMNNIDLAYADQKEIIVKNVSGYSTDSVAQQTFAMLLEMSNHITYNNDYVKSTTYSNQTLFTHLGPTIEELNGKTIGIIGLGNIGRKVATIASAFGMSVIYHSTSGSHLEQDYPHVNLPDLMQRADVISIHAPLNDKTLNLITHQELKQCKPNAILLNMGRGGIVNENDLVEALLQNQLKGACLDVFEQEPISIKSLLLNKKLEGKLLLTPHIAWASKQAREKLWKLTLENIKGYLKK